jgi:hypothetical protein
MKKTLLSIPVIAAFAFAPITASAHGGFKNSGHFHDSYRVIHSGKYRGKHYDGMGNISEKHFHKEVHARMDRQAKRIRKGVKSGELTSREAYKLKDQLARTRNTENQYWSDRHFTYAERLDLMKRLNRASNHIFSKKHNQRTKGERYYSYRFDF